MNMVARINAILSAHRYIARQSPELTPTRLLLRVPGIEQKLFDQSPDSPKKRNGNCQCATYGEYDTESRRRLRRCIKPGQFRMDRLAYHAIHPKHHCTHQHPAQANHEQHPWFFRHFVITPKMQAGQGNHQKQRNPDNQTIRVQRQVKGMNRNHVGEKQ